MSRFLVDVGGMAAVDPSVGGEAVFVEREPLFEGERAHGDVVFLGAGEVVQGEGKLRVGDGAEVALDAVFQADGGFGVAAGDDGVDLRQRGEILADERGFLGGDEEIEVMHGFLGAAERAGHGDAARSPDGGAGVSRISSTSGVMSPSRKVSAKVSRRAMASRIFVWVFAPKPGSAATLSGVAGGLEIGDGADAERFVERFDFLRAEALEIEEFEQARRETRRGVFRGTPVCRWLASSWSLSRRASPMPLMPVSSLFVGELRRCRRRNSGRFPRPGGRRGS